MAQSSVGTYLRFLRKKSGLTQQELAQILGSATATQVSRHERSVTPPGLLIAFGYQAVFRKPVSDIFPGLYYAVESGVEERLAAFENELRSSTVKGRAAEPIARRVEWFWERKNDLN